MFQKALWLTMGGILIAAFVISCSDDDPAAPVPKQSPYLNLTQPEHVLINLETAVNERNYDEYERLVDPEFVFVFSLGDYNRGDTPENWGRAGELPSAAKMFNLNYVGVHAVKTIDLSLQYTDDDWTPTTPPDTLLYPGETWYKKAFRYSFTVLAEPDFTFTGQDLTAEMVVRAEGGTWKIVEWRDETTAARGKSEGMASNAVQDFTWGHVKALYEGDAGYQDLACRDDVLTNLELAYNERSLSQVEKLIGEEFTFFFSQEDQAVHGTPQAWGNTAETSATRNLFDPAYGADPATSVSLAMMYPAGAWTSMIARTAESTEGELWYTKTVRYSMTVQTNHITYISYDITAEFAVRRAVVGGEEVWQIARWRDDIYSSGALAAKDAMVESTTWGAIKWLFYQ